MRILSWNIKGNNGVSAPRLDRIIDAIVGDGADIVLLQEVAWRTGLHEAVQEKLAAAGLGSAAYSGQLGSADMRYGNVTVSRWPLRVQRGCLAPPRRQSLLTVVAVTPQGELEVTNAHVPNGSGNGWAKVDTFEVLAARLVTSTHMRVLGGDFNEPQRIEADGTLLPFGGRKRPDGSWTFDGTKKGACGERHPRQRWHDAVTGVLGVDAPHGLVSAQVAVGDATRFGATHVVRGANRPFDHILVDSRLPVRGCGAIHEWRTRGLSDHSAVYATIGRGFVLAGSGTGPGES
jgi:endonuclease/exonuclease/phosphatase family metal-dependent hydrolase